MKNKDLDLKALPAQFAKLGHKLAAIAPLAFFILVAIVFGMLLLRITAYANIQPDSSDVNSEVAQLTPHIDQKAASQLQSLEDNSVNVQTLFNQARNNPFGE